MRFFAPDYTIAPPRRPLTQESQRQPDPKPRRINHLGVPLRPGGSMRHKYARTYTICFDPTKPLAKEADLQRWRLLRDAKNAADCSSIGLIQLNERFRSCLKSEQVVVGPRTFRLVLMRQGVRDAVLQNRLWAELQLLSARVVGLLAAVAACAAASCSLLL